MAVDQKNYLWVGTQDGAAFYNGRKWTVVNMPIKTVANEIRSMLVTADGSILFGTIAGGLVKLKENRWTVYDTVRPCLTTG
jgi:ligand-binding sensor domain-containing protein